MRCTAWWAAVLRFGTFIGLKGPGRFWIVPIVDTIPRWIDHRVMVTPFNAERTLTKDTVPVDVDAVLFWLVWDAEKAALQVAVGEDTILPHHCTSSTCHCELIHGTGITQPVSNCHCERSEAISTYTRGDCFVAGAPDDKRDSPQAVALGLDFEKLLDYTTLVKIESSQRPGRGKS